MDWSSQPVQLSRPAARTAATAHADAGRHGAVIPTTGCAPHPALNRLRPTVGRPPRSVKQRGVEPDGRVDRRAPGYPGNDPSAKGDTRMVSVGYTLMCEQAGPKQLVDHAVRAEAAGFDQLVMSDHYYPWLDSQGHSPYAWSVLGAVAHATSRARADVLRDLPDPPLPPGGGGAEGQHHRGALRRPVHPRPRRRGEPERARGRRLAARRSSGTRCSRRRCRSSGRCSTGRR